MNLTVKTKYLYYFLNYKAKLETYMYADIW